MISWQLFKTPKLSGQASMELDLEIFQDFENGLIPSTLRIYSWQPKCITYGYTQKIEKLIDLKKARVLGWDVIKRPTGGGIVFHNEAEVTYSLVTERDNPLLPEGLVPSYKKISEAIAEGLGRMGISAQIRNSKSEILKKFENLNSKQHLCFSYPAEYEVVANGKKIVGSAQKRGKRTLLQQGSIFIQKMRDEDFSILKVQGEKNIAISIEEILGQEIGFSELSEALVEGFEKVLNINICDKIPKEGDIYGKLA